MPGLRSNLDGILVSEFPQVRALSSLCRSIESTNERRRNVAHCIGSEQLRTTMGFFSSICALRFPATLEQSNGLRFGVVIGLFLCISPAFEYHYDSNPRGLRCTNQVSVAGILNAKQRIRQLLTKLFPELTIRSVDWDTRKCRKERTAKRETRTN